MIGNLFRAAVGIVTLPVDLVADVLTLPANAYYDREFYTARKARSIMRNIEEATRHD
jgi:hypothetical protein